jgi:xanthine dehydrogenase small subunit
MEHSINFSLNGEAKAANCRADTTVLEWLRADARLRGTKEGCAEGDCGACSVLVRRPGHDKHLPTNACILLMGQLEGASLVTVEGLAESASGGHPVQQEMEVNGSSQCGFCTPGIVVALAGLLDSNAEPQEDEIHDALAGNLCRCTGYRPIVEAAQAAAKAGGALPGAEAIPAKGEVGGAESVFHLPKSLAELHDLRAAHPGAVLLAGGTDIALNVAQAKARWPRAILTRDVADLRSIEERDGTIIFGAAATWQEMLPHLHKHWPSFATLVRRFGSVQIRAQGTIGGNLGTASPIGDGSPALLVLGATLILSGPNGDRDVPLADYFLDYRKTVRRDDEVIRAVSVLLPETGEEMRVYKVSKRYDQDISTVCGAFHVAMDGGTVAAARLAFGGMAATPVRCMAAEAALVGQPVADGIRAAKDAVLETFSPMTDMRGSADYRATVAANLLDRFAADLAGETVEVMAL